VTPTNQIRSCVNQIVLSAQHKAAAKQRVECAHQHTSAMAHMFATYKRKLEDAGVDSNVIADAAGQALAAVQGASSDSRPDSATGHDNPILVTPPAKKARKTKDRGSLSLEKSPVDMRRGDPKARLEWIIKNADHNPNQYDESSRTKIRRNKPIAECYRVCCNSDVDTFLQKHKTVTNAGREQHFIYAKFKCKDCSQRKLGNLV